MLYTNALVFLPERGFTACGFRVENGRFSEIVAPDVDEPGAVDLGGRKVIPGLIDIHTHGNSGADFSDADAAGLERIARYLAPNGVTSFCPTSMTLPYATLAAAFETAAGLREKQPQGCARLAGIHMEGPYFSEKKKGAQNAVYLRQPDFEGFQRLYEGCGGLISIVDLAPELEGTADFVRKASALCTVSVAHTDADYAQARAVYDAGARHLTHLYNAMPPIHHRKPGVIGAAAETESVCAELICDGLHIHPSAVRMAFRLFPGRICLVSDALRCCGMPDGEYELGGQQVFLRGGVAKLADGTIAGAASNLYQDLQNAIAFGIAEDEAIRAATENPARQIGKDKELGAIAPGYRADFLVCDQDLTLREVYIDGVKVKEYL